MPHYEIHFGGFTHWCQAESPIRAAMLAFRACLDQWHTFPRSPFLVIDTDKDNDGETVGLQLVLSLLNVLNEDVPPFPSEEAQLEAEQQWINGELCS